MPRYTPEEIATLVVMRSAGSQYEEIREVILEKYGVDRKENTLSAKYNSIIAKTERTPLKDSLKPKQINSEKNWRNENATRRQLRTLASLTAPNSTGKDRMILADSFEAKGMTKGEASDLIQLNMEKEEEPETTNPVVLSKKKKKATHWTDIQIKLLFDMYNSKKTWKQISEVIGRTQKSCQAKRHSLIRSGEWVRMIENQSVPSRLRKFIPTEKSEEETILEESQEPVEVSHEHKTWVKSPVEKKETLSWTHSQDMNILINFYEMSIDEVREAFARPYWVVAQRLEMLFDSTEPEHIAMLMEASDIVLKRKSPRTEKPQKPSRKERRAAKRADKRAAKVARLEAKMERKLNRLRGE